MKLSFVFGLSLGFCIFPAILFAEPQAKTPELRIAILGNPDKEVEWSAAHLNALKDLGFNAIQVNIAWDIRPFDNPLNLVDVITLPGETKSPATDVRLAELMRRVTLAKNCGFRTLFEVGSPFINRNPYTGEVKQIGQAGVNETSKDSWYDIRNPKVVDHEIRMLRELRRRVPNLDDLIVYTYDQDAWQTSEFGASKLSAGIPLPERLPQYLEQLRDEWNSGRAEKHILWWEPWELSAGQSFAVLEKLSPAGFGLLIHTNVAEAQLAIPVDVWFRNIARLCKDKNIPVVAETFWSSASEEMQPLRIPAPRLIDEAYLAVMRVPGVIGIKEYYGIVPDDYDFDLQTLRLRLKYPDESTADILEKLSEPFGNESGELRQYLNLLADAYQTYPWDASWHAREIGNARIDHAWTGATILGAVAETPAWDSTRHAIFMRTDNSEPNPWMLEDVQLRCELTALTLEKAHEVFGELSGKIAEPQGDILRRVDKDADHALRVSRSYALHIRETNIAMQLRREADGHDPLNPILVAEMRVVLQKDAANQEGDSSAANMVKLFSEDPESFVSKYLLPNQPITYSRGFFSLTSR